MSSYTQEMAWCIQTTSLYKIFYTICKATMINPVLPYIYGLVSLHPVMSDAIVSTTSVESVPRPKHDDVIKWKLFRVTGPLCDGNPPITGGFPSQRPVTQSFDVFFYLCLNTQLRKQSRRRWFEIHSRSLWRYCNEVLIYGIRMVIWNTPKI